MSKIAIIISVTVVMILAIAIPNFLKSRQTSASNVYINILRNIDGAKQQWAIAGHKAGKDTPIWSELLPYVGGGMTNFYVANGVIVRPAGGVFTIGRVDELPSGWVDGQRVDYK